MSTSTKYSEWTREQLLERILELEKPKRAIPPKSAHSTTESSTAGPSKQSGAKPFTFYDHPRRKIALKFSYAGWEYGGLAFQSDKTPLPTVEGVLFDALATAHLVDPEAGLDGCGWERCGRTDRGVSGARQIVSLWVRSALPKEELPEADLRPGPIPTKDSPESLQDDEITTTISKNPEGVFIPDEIKPQSRNEHDYSSILNRLLPDTIRIAAWSPVPSSFSSRFSCTYRHYKYFFSLKDLDIQAMEEGAARMVGEHDFRNLCKIDAAKQLTSFKRNVINAYLERLDDNLYVFNLIGSAFLYHQVRHIMAILFYIGTGVESPSLVTNLMNVSPGEEPPYGQDGDYEVVDRKPEYQMTDGLPLMLWDCGYPEGTFSWRTSGRPNGGPIATGGTLNSRLENILVRSQIYSALHRHFHLAAADHHPAPINIFPLSGPAQLAERKGPRDTIDIPLGGGTFKRMIKYKPVLRRNRLDTVEVTNERWRLRQGAKKGGQQGAAVDSPEAAS
ncbi:pseudouridine synthase [Coprinopsis marcescibilis]|uniref:Pseudouridine synthase n=1 Tax=Coprinopsis marcescibilis TaxID=230819 RepID=A0A5C3L8K1_COPMA|nr:pseudouridine synthase [Coprinopsis marcescibilis]